MRVQVYSCRLPKGGNQESEYEDAGWPARSTAQVGQTVRCAVADGATETSFSGLWATMLVAAFGRGRICSSRLVEALAPLQAAWWSEVNRKPLPWYAEEKMRSGAFSSLLGVTLTEGRSDAVLRWTATAVGDSCLFVVRAGQLITSFPIEKSQRFDNSPQLISSTPGPNRELASMVRRDSGECTAGDMLYLLTDALACWFLSEYESGGHPWDTLDSLGSTAPDGGFATWMTRERRRHRIRNDDVTMLCLRVE